MPCCGGASCACQITGGDHVTVSGSGSPSNPIVIDVEPMTVLDNTTFDLTLAGNVLSVAYASTAKLDGLPDVNASTPTNGQVLSWNSATLTWVPANPTTAASGSVTHDASLSGDGSVGTPLQVNEDPARMLATTGSGLGLTDPGMNQIVRAFTDDTARGTATPFPTTNALSTVTVRPGQIDYFDGTAWKVVPGLNKIDMTGQLLNLSGPFTAGLPMTQMVRQITASTDAAGVFEILSVADLTGAAGVVTVQFQETGAIAYKAMVVPSAGTITGVAYKLTDGTVLALQNITGTVLAWLY